MEIKFTVEIEYTGHTYKSSIIIGDDGSVTEEAGDEPRQYDSFEAWAGTWSPGCELPKLFPLERRNELNGARVRWESTDPTKLFVNDRVFTVKLRAKIGAAQPQRTSRRKLRAVDDPNQRNFFHRP